jgi:hypothetical protein
VVVLTTTEFITFYILVQQYRFIHGSQVSRESVSERLDLRDCNSGYCRLRCCNDFHLSDTTQQKNGRMPNPDGLSHSNRGKSYVIAPEIKPNRGPPIRTNYDNNNNNNQDYNNNDHIAEWMMMYEQMQQ